MTMALQTPVCSDSELAIEHFPCSGLAIQREPLVLLHGWGSDRRIWQALLPGLTPHLNVITLDLPGFGNGRAVSNFTLEQVLGYLVKILPERFSIMGWSLGGMLATALAHRYPQRVSALGTIASNACFTQRDGWQWAMPETTFQSFSNFFQRQPEQCLLHFHALQSKGDECEKALLKKLRANFGTDFFETNFGPGVGQSIKKSWHQALALLSEMDNRELLQSLKVPGLHLYGANDSLVPAGVAEAIARLNSRQQTRVIEKASHVMPLSCPRQLADALLRFLHQCHYHLDKQRVASSFSRAASHYDSEARLQRQVGTQLLALLPDHLQPRCVVDVGCGTGYFTGLLAEKYPSARVFGLDLAEGMLQFSAGSRGREGQWLCGDAESLPLVDDSVDLIFSSLTFQWCEQLPALAAELSRVLSKDGLLAFTTLAEGTLHELHTAWAEVDDYVHVNQFLQASHWQEVFAAAGLQFQHFQAAPEVLYYQDLRNLTNELKGVGAHNINSGQKTGLTGRQQLRLLVQAYEQFRDEQGLLPATWQVVYCLLEKSLLDKGLLASGLMDKELLDKELLDKGLAEKGLLGDRKNCHG